MIKGIDHVEITTGNLEKTVSFHTNILGFKIKERNQMDRPPLEEIDYLTFLTTLLNNEPLSTSQRLRDKLRAGDTSF